MSESNFSQSFYPACTIWTDYSKLTSCQTVEMASSCSWADSAALYTDYPKASVFTEDERRTGTLYISSAMKEMHKCNLALWSLNS